MLYYWSKIFTANLQVGHEYEKLRKTICILIVDDDIKELNQEIARMDENQRMKDAKREGRIEGKEEGRAEGKKESEH